MLKKTFSRLSQIGAHSDDSDEVRLGKSLLAIGSFLYGLAGLLWGLVYFALGEWLPGWIPFGFGLVTAVSLLLYGFTRKYRLFRFSQLTFGVVLPFLLMITLGGFVNGSAVIIWSFLAPIGALLFSRGSLTTRWFMAYLVVLLASGFLESGARPDNLIPDYLKIVFFVLNIGAVTGISFFLLKYFVQQKDETMRLLAEERHRSETLLLNILPQSIAERLKSSSSVIADRFENASILFADISGFTPLSAKMSPDDMVALLNQIYSHFDTLAEEYKVEKIRTIGDNYMVASGVPVERPDHAHALAGMALDILEYCRSLPAYHDTNIDFRIGIHSGPLVAGVIGHKKFQYDVWGDTVNTASRMESHGVVGKIQISVVTHQLLGDEFECEKRGPIEVKGKGQMETWFLTGRKQI